MQCREVQLPDVVAREDLTFVSVEPNAHSIESRLTINLGITPSYPRRGRILQCLERFTKIRARVRGVFPLIQCRSLAMDLSDLPKWGVGSGESAKITIALCALNS
jgi:hypothetical protein